MTNDLNIWLRTQRAAECAGAPKAWDRWLLASRYYFPMLRRGYRMPFFAVCDLAWLYASGPDPTIEGPRPKTPLLAQRRPDLAEPLSKYQKHLNGILEQGPLREFLIWSLRAREVKTGAAPATLPPGLKTFLELFADCFPNCKDSPDWIRLNASLHERRHENKVTEAQGEEHWDGFSLRTIREFCERLKTLSFGQGEKDFLKFLARTTANDGTGGRAGKVAGAAAQTPATTAESIDLGLLDSCLNYQPLTGQEEWLRNLRRPQRSENRRGRTNSPSFEGITRSRRPINNVLRTELAKPNFIIRYLMHEVLFLDPWGPMEEPYELVMAWVIDRGLEMRKGMARGLLHYDGAALRLAAANLEDVARRLAGIETLNLRLFVIVHNGEREDQLRAFVIQPGKQELAAAATLGQSGKNVWWPMVSSAQYFHREPRWSEKDDVFARFGPGHGSCWERAIRVIAANAEAANEETGTVNKINLCHVTLLGKRENLRMEDAETLLGPLHRVADHAAVSLCALHQSGIDWEVWRPLLGSPVLKTPTSYEDALTKTRLRHSLWNDLKDRLARL